LISYLLDEERKRTGDINTKQFYLRRMARIWPLYFLVVIPAIPLNLYFAPATFHTNMVWMDYALLAIILPGFANMPQFVGPTWSIGIEESFYAMYPLMARYLSKRNLAVLLLAVVFSTEIFSFIGRYTCPELCSVRVWWAPEWYGCIAIGCLTYMIYSAKNEQITKFLFSPGLQCAAFSALAVALSAGVFAERFFSYRLQSVALSIIAINAAFNPASILQIENRLTKYIGEISYGMYMFHVYCICLVLLLCWIFFKGETFPFQNLIVSTLSLSLTIVVSKLSYDYFESPIRKWARQKDVERQNSGLLQADRTAA